MQINDFSEGPMVKGGGTLKNSGRCSYEMWEQPQLQMIQRQRCNTLAIACVSLVRV